MTERIIELARVGFGIIPCNPDKTPRIPNWSRESLRDPAAITAFWQFCPDSLVGYTPPAGTMVIDVDTAGLSQIGDDAHPWPAGGWQYRTPSGGLHAVLALPEGIIGKTDTGKIAPGIDRRAHGTGYAIAWFLHGHEFLGDGGAYQAAPEWTWRDLVGTSGAAALKPFDLSEAELRTLAARAIKQSDRYDDYTEWYQLGMMLHHETGGGDLGLELFDQISRAAPKYEGSTSIAAKWRSFDTTGGLRIAKLIADTGSSDLARAAGARAAFRDHIKIDTMNASKLANDINTLDLSAGATSVSVVSAGATDPNPMQAAIDREAAAMVLLESGCEWDAKAGKFYGHARNANVAARVRGFGRRYGYDTFKSSIMHQPWGAPDDNEWQPLDDVEVHKCRDRLWAAGFDADIPLTKIREAIFNSAHDFTFDSAQLWLGRQVWDGKPRVDRFMAEYCGAVDDDYATAIGRYLWSAAAGRVLVPGCQADMVVAWISRAQGLQKSQSIKAMNPSWENYTTLNLAERDDNLTRNTFGMLICELGEMRGILKGADIEGVKVWLTKGADFHVPKYIQNGSLIQRRFILIATTNEGEILNDPSGSRRWLPIEVNRLDHAAITRDRDQLWAEGAVRFRALAQPNDPRNSLGMVEYADAERLARARAGDFTVYDDMTPSVEEAVGKVIVDGVFAARDVWGHLGLPAQTGGGSVMDKRIANVLRNLGYELKVRRHPATGKVGRLWKLSNT